MKPMLSEAEKQELVEWVIENRRRKTMVEQFHPHREMVFSNPDRSFHGETLRERYFDETRPVPKKAVYHNGHWMLVVIAPKEVSM